MKLNESKGDMYNFIDCTTNPIKGKCSHDCSYCYMRQCTLSNTRLDETGLNERMEENKNIFVGSGTDMFADDVPEDWIRRTLDYCNNFNNQYLFQSKNPRRILDFIGHSVFSKSVVCTTIETNRHYPDIMGNSPKIEDRVEAMEKIADTDVTPYKQSLFDESDLSPRKIDTYVTIEPIMKFDLSELVECIRRCKPKQVNIGANSMRGVKLLEPSKDEVIALKSELSVFTKVEQKTNLARLMK